MGTYLDGGDRDSQARNQHDPSGHCACGGTATTFEDRSPRGVAQRKLNQLITQSPRTQQFAALQSFSGAAPIQRTVKQLRTPGRKWVSSELPDQTFDTKEQALAAERKKVADDKEAEAARALEERPEVNFQFVPPTSAPPTITDPTSLALHQHRAHFGPLLTTGGHVHRNQVSALLPSSSSAPSITKDTAFTGKDTNAAILTSGPGDIRHVFGPTGNSTSLDDLPGTDPFEFHKNHIFKQGRPPEGVTLPDGRRTAHAEANAVHSRGFTGAVKKNASDLSAVAKLLDIDLDNLDDEDDLIAALGLPPVTTDIVENRTSCGSHGKSGYGGGCNQEMADTVARYQSELEAHLPPSFSFLATQTGLASFGLSAAGSYRHEGNPGIITGAGGRIGTHHAFDWKTGQARHPKENLQAYYARAHAHEHEAHDDVDEEGEVSDDEEAEDTVKPGTRAKRVVKSKSDDETSDTDIPKRPKKRGRHARDEPDAEPPTNHDRDDSKEPVQDDPAPSAPTRRTSRRSGNGSKKK
ncbi:hypothetical protein ACPWR0_02300 [Pandoraea pneumonica]|uniref:hypothetical protein n=1 Tax=Pandoraea pneumonica TaxID=2508299 RepID=UPI003CE97AEF